MFRIDGLEKFTAQIKRLETNARALEGKHSVKVTDLFTDGFMRQHTPFDSLGELEQACPHPLLTSDEWEAPPEVDQFIRERTKFSSWHDMVEAAGARWVEKQMMKGV